MKQEYQKPIRALSDFGYIVGCLCLYLIALGIIAMAIYSILSDLSSPDFAVYRLLDEVALIVFSIAVIDVAKYLLIQEVLYDKANKNYKEMRNALSEFGIIIATALSLEGLVLTIEQAKKDVTNMIYPMALLVTAILFIVAIAVYQKLNADAERK